MSRKKTKTVKKGPLAYFCRSCGHSQKHFKFEFYRATAPRCTCCGGSLDRASVHFAERRLCREPGGKVEAGATGIKDLPARVETPV